MEPARRSAVYERPAPTATHEAGQKPAVQASEAAVAAAVVVPGEPPLTRHDLGEILGTLGQWVAGRAGTSPHEWSALSREQDRLFQAILGGDKHLLTSFPNPPALGHGITVEQQQAYALPAATVTLPAMAGDEGVGGSNDVQGLSVQNEVARNVSEGKAGGRQESVLEPATAGQAQVMRKIETHIEQMATKKLSNLEAFVLGGTDEICKDIAALHATAEAKIALLKTLINQLNALPQRRLALLDNPSDKVIKAHYSSVSTMLARAFDLYVVPALAAVPDGADKESAEAILLAMMQEQFDLASLRESGLIG